MLQVKLTNCTNCLSLLDTLCDVDNKLKTYSCNAYNNLTLMTCLHVDKDNLETLLHYKRILTSHLYNPDYVPCVPLADIISRVKILINK
jgi:hypothetical protein